MKDHYELTYDKLKKACHPEELGFETTLELDPLEVGAIAQDRAVKALEFGLKINSKGYNIYVSGVTGSGKTSYAYNYVNKIAKDQHVPDDWCYVYNFEKPSQPLAIELPVGVGKVFSKDVEEFVTVMQVELAKAFDSDEYEKEKQKIIIEYQEQRNLLLEKLNETSEKQGFKVKATASGIYFLPIVDGKPVTEEEYTNLDDETKMQIDEKSTLMQVETMELIRKIKSVEKDVDNKITDWENRIALFAVGVHINDLKEKYKDYEKVVKYLDSVQEDILDNLDDFRGVEDDTEETPEIPQWLKKAQGTDFSKYKVNVIIDNSELKGSPVIVDYNPTYYNVLGRIEYENEMGNMITDFTKIKAGLLHQANGGYLILQAKDVLNNTQTWELIKRTLRTQKIVMENIKENMGLVAISTLKPEPIPINIKVILIGGWYLYQMLYKHDEDFRKLFKIKADFDDEMKRTPENVNKLARFIAAFAKREESRPFDKTAVAKIVEHCSFLVDNQNKITTKFNEIVEVLFESNTWAEIDGCDIITSEHVKTALKEKTYRANRYDDILIEMVEDGSVMINTEGLTVGQINGLSVIDVGNYAFGKPSRITATTFAGKSGIINIEREIEMSGSSHDKGVLILSGFLGERYAQSFPLSLTASLCFEQLYNGVDGDSASSTELYALLSSLSGVPIRQNLAVTGSVNQKGEIQPIGGATQKIEGFLEICQMRGLTGDQGIVLPYQNVQNLVLNDEVVEAVKAGKFHIYPVASIDEGIEILTGIPAGVIDENGNYPEGTINYLVMQKLKKYYDIDNQSDNDDK